MRFLGLDGEAATDKEPINDFDCYLSTQVAMDADITVLDWWLKRQSDFPATAAVARQYLAIPASSVAFERLISAQARLISKMRSCMLPKHAEMLIFFNKNSALLK